MRRSLFLSIAVISMSMLGLGIEAAFSPSKAQEREGESVKLAVASEQANAGNNVSAPQVASGSPCVAQGTFFTTLPVGVSKSGRNLSSDCIAGGLGFTSCSIDRTIFGQPVSCEVTCLSGYYPCCGFFGCYCIPGKGSDDGGGDDGGMERLPDPGS